MTYQVINEVVGHLDADMTAAQAHGIATGMLCVNHQTQCGSWLAELFRDAPELTAHEQAILVHWFANTQNLLASDEFEFDLCLPDDEATLSVQVQALTEWCQGFLFGIGFTQASSGWSREVSEILKDIVEFTKLDTKAEGEEDENDFMEIVEYMRSAVLLLRSELTVQT